MTTLNPSCIPDLKSQIDSSILNTTTNPTGLPGVQYYAVNRQGEYIFSHTAGKVGAGREVDLADRHVCWMASCTKLVTAVAAMQLVERGVFRLDDVGFVEGLAPELKDVKVIGEDGRLVEKKRGITLRMLMTHTSGFGYSFANQRLLDHYGPAGINELSGNPWDYLSQPLVNQPGETFEYGIGLDWTGELITRATGQSLNDYFVQNIFKPLGIENDISLLPDDQLRKDLTYLHLREASGRVKLRDDGTMFRAPVTFQTPEEGRRIFQAGGAGAFARPKAYCQILATLLNDGVHSPTGNKILDPKTVEQMFTNQIPDMPDFARKGSPPSKAEYVHPAPELYPEPGSPPQGWGLSFFLHLSDSMVHSKGTAWWCGLPNLFWWCDRAKGIGGIIATQIVPCGDLEVIQLWAGIEAGLYQNLVQA